MFTGLIEEVGIVKNTDPFGKGKKIVIQSSIVVQDAKLGDSINVNGTCQTVVETDKDFFVVEAVEETLKKTNLGKLKSGDKVNLESSLTLNKKLGGHFVLGHIDATGIVKEIKKLTASYLVKIEYPEVYRKYIIHVGSIAVEGISLTVADYSEKDFTISVIPHTWENTNLKVKKLKESVNLEFDVLGKYVEKMIGKKSESKISEEWLKDLGY